MKTKSFIYTLLSIITALLFTSCSNDEDIFIEPVADDNKVHFDIGISLPGAVNGETRAFGGDGNEYFTFKDLYVAVFVDIEGVSYLEEFVRANNTAPTWDGEKWVFGVELTKTDDKRRLHIIANYPDLTMGFGEEGQLVGRLLADGANHDVYWNFYELNKINEETKGTLRNVPLLRNYAKILVKDSRPENKRSNFRIEGYTLYNVPTKGTVAPYNPTSTTKFANFIYKTKETGTGTETLTCQSYDYLLNTEKYEGNEPYDDGTLLSTELPETDEDWKSISEPSYIYERSNRTATNPTCIIIKGKFKNDGNITDDTPYTYYKLDFVYDDATTNSKVYYNLLRNFIFTMNIESVSGPGYDSPEEAIKNPASNNIGGDAIADSYTNISDGTGRLFVSSTYVLFTNNQERELYFKYIPNLTNGNTDNGSVNINAPEGTVLKENATIATSNESSGTHAGWRKVTLKPNDVTTVSRSQKLIFSAGNLQREVELVLRQPYTLTVDVPAEVAKAAKTSLDVKITLPTGLPESIFPLRLFISSQKNTIYPQYGTNLPAEAQNGKYGFIKEVSLNEYKESREVNCEFLTNCASSATAVYVDNEYFNRASDSFTNTEVRVYEINIPTDTNVTIQTETYNYGFMSSNSVKVHPYNIHNVKNHANSNKQNNNGTESVTVSIKGVTGTITIDIDNVTKGTTISIPAGVGLDDVITFTFRDKYCTGINTEWWDLTGFKFDTDNVEYKATCTVEQMLNGTTLNFTHQ